MGLLKKKKNKQLQKRLVFKILTKHLEKVQRIILEDLKILRKPQLKQFKMAYIRPVSKDKERHKNVKHHALEHKVPKITVADFEKLATETATNTTTLSSSTNSLRSQRSIKEKHIKRTE